MSEFINQLHWGTVAEFATAIITALSAFFILVQLRLDHERSRRQTAVDLLCDWTKTQTLWTSAVVAFVSQFNTEQAEALVSRQPLLFLKNSETKTRLVKCFEIEFPNAVSDIDGMAEEIHYVVTSRYAAHLRFHAVNYLNHLESVLSAWNGGLAHGDIIEDQFLFLRKQGALRKIREAFKDSNGGVEGFPSIANFLNATAPHVRRRLGLVDHILNRRHQPKR